MFKIGEWFSKALGLSDKSGRPHVFSDAGEGFDIGDTREFSDGSVRVLGYAPSGVRRWMSTKEAEQAGIAMGKKQGAPDSTPSSVLVDKIPDKIVVEEWDEYNKYLDGDNPFVHCITYGQMEAVWFSKAYEYNEREEYLKDDPERLKDLENKKTLLDNQFLAIQMYKVSCIIYQITEWQPNFNYKEFMSEGDKGWQELVDYLQELKQPQEVDYLSLYGESEDDGNSPPEIGDEQAA